MYISKVRDKSKIQVIKINVLQNRNKLSEATIKHVNYTPCFQGCIFHTNIYKVETVIPKNHMTVFKRYLLNILIQ